MFFPQESQLRICFPEKSPRLVQQSKNRVQIKINIPTPEDASRNGPMCECAHEIKRRLLHGRKVMTNLDSILQSRGITLPTKVHLVKAIIFPVVMYGCESWTVKKAEHHRFNAFDLWWWRRLLRVPCTARRSNQSILKEISPECSLEGLMLKLKL